LKNLSAFVNSRKYDDDGANESDFRKSLNCNLS